MDLGLGETYERLRDEARAFARDHWPPRGEEAALPLREQEVRFRRRAIEAGLLARAIPAEYGGAGLAADVLAEIVIRRELAAAGTPWRPNPQGPDMLVPTLLEEGSEAQRRQHIPATLVGERLWCQGYSEPGAGSDLGSLQSRAEFVGGRDGDHWVVNGQKIWTSSAREADMMFGLFRTEPDRPRSRGLSYLLLDMKSPGIDVRPLTMMNGGVDFCEVFFDDVRVPAENLVGERGEGWKVSKATLKHERMLIGDASYLEAAFRDLLALARRQRREGRPAIAHPAVRQRLAEIEGYVASQLWASTRMVSAIARDQDMKAVPEMLTTKLALTNVMERICECALDLLGDAGLTEPTAEEGGMAQGWETPGKWVSAHMMSLGLSLAGGTSHIQRNLIGERLLGLPRQPRPNAS